MVHYYELLAQCQIDLYAGAGTDAWRRLDAAWRSLERSMLVRRAESIRISALFLRARCALAAAAAEPGAADSLLREASRVAQRLAREQNHWNRHKAALIGGLVAAARDDVDAAIPLLVQAVEGFEATDMALHAAVARRRLGELRGDELVAVADAWMQGQNIACPDRMAQMLAPR